MYCRNPDEIYFSPARGEHSNYDAYPTQGFCLDDEEQIYTLFQTELRQKIENVATKNKFTLFCRQVYDKKLRKLNFLRIRPFS